jgi:hypothetical protein
VATMAVSPDSLPNTILDAIDTPATIVTDIVPPPVRLVESRVAFKIVTDSTHIPPQGQIHSQIDSSVLHKIVENGLEQVLSARNRKITSISILDLLHDEELKSVSKLEKHHTARAVSGRQALFAALTTNTRWSYLDNAADLEIAQYFHAWKHFKPFEKAIDQVLAEGDAMLVEL